MVCFAVVHHGPVQIEPRLLLGTEVDIHRDDRLPHVNFIDSEVGYLDLIRQKIKGDGLVVVEHHLVIVDEQGGYQRLDYHAI